MNDNILFLSIMYPKTIADFYNKKGFISSGENVTFIQTVLIESIDKLNQKPIDIINKLYIKRGTSAFVPEISWKHAKKYYNDISFSYYNKPIFSSNLLFYFAKKHIDKWLKLNSGRKMVIAYALTQYSLKALSYIKKKDPSIRTGLIVPDLPEHTKSHSKNPLINLKNNIANHMMILNKQKANKYIDKYFLFSKHMAKALDCENKYRVIEGIATDTFSNIKPTRLFENDKKIVLYGGGLHKRYGIALLCDAFQKIKDENFRLVLCGEGDYVPTIKLLAEKDPRICYLGRVERDTLLSYQKGADVLVNPRTSDGIFTNYSFPSKNMEYLSSGVPFVGFKLGGIGDEYDKYINYCEETPDAMAKKIVEVCTTQRQNASKRALDAKNFVLNFKNKNAQAKLLLDFMLED